MLNVLCILVIIDQVDYIVFCCFNIKYGCQLSMCSLINGVVKGEI